MDANTTVGVPGSRSKTRAGRCEDRRLHRLGGGSASFAGGMGAEDAGEDFVDAAELAIEVEYVFQLFGIEIFGDALILRYTVTEAGVGFPGGHGVFLNGFVGFVARHSLFDQILKKLAGENQPLGGVEVAQHAFGEHAQLADDGGHFVEHVVDENGGVGENNALDGGVGDVALVPEGNVFEGRHHVAANKTGESADLLAGDGIALVGHGGAATLLTAEIFLDLADFGALEMADFQGDFFECGGDEGKGAEIMRMAVAGDDLRGDARNRETKALADFLFDVGAEMCGIAYCAGNFAESDLAGSLLEAINVTLIFGEPVGDFEAEGDGLGVDTVGTADLRRVLKFVSAQVKDFAEKDEIAFNDAGGVAQKQRLSGVDHVVGGHAIVEPARGVGIANGFADGHGEGDDVVFDLGFELVDTGDVNFGAGAKQRGGFPRDLASFGEGISSGKFDVEPFLVAVSVAPDAAHFFTGVAWNHSSAPIPAPCIIAR